MRGEILRHTPEFATHYRKGLNNETKWNAFVKHRLGKAPHALRCAANHDRRDRLPVDSYVFSTFSPDLDLWDKFLPVPPEVGSPELDADMDFLFELANNRDRAITDSPAHYRLGLRRVSYFLQSYQQNNFRPGVEYMTTAAHYNRVQDGDSPTETQQYNAGQGPIVSARDGARFVHDDNPMRVFTDAYMLARSLGARANSSVVVTDYVDGGQADFFVNNNDIVCMIYEVAKRAARVSFRTKWAWMYPRPEQYAVDSGRGFLPAAFAEGSPVHPATTAMHAVLYFALAKLVKQMVDPLFVLPSGETVEYELDNLAENGAYWRQFASVHWTHDQALVKPLAEAIADRVILEHTNRVRQHMMTQR